MRSIIEWFVRNPVASNLLMLFIIIGGITGLGNVSKTVFPSGAIDTIQVSVAYLGANPADVEERILIPIEEAVSSLQGIKRINSRGFEGRGTVTIDAIEGYDVDILLNEVKSRVDSINTFPTMIERPVVRRFYATVPVMFLLVAGNVDEITLKETGQNIRDRIASIPGAENTILDGAKDYEVSVEVSEFQLEKYGLTFDDVARTIRRSSVNVGAGMIDDVSGQTQLMTRGQAYVEQDFMNMVVATQEDGNQILLQDVADINDGFADQDWVLHFEGLPTLLIRVDAGANPDVVSLSKQINQVLDEDIRPILPDGIRVDPLIDTSESFSDRLSLLTVNGVTGLILVFLSMTLFLTPRLALWVTAGICISFLGCFLLLPYFGIPLSMLSTFALVLILGIVVDDAVIIGESIHRQNEKGIWGAQASIEGAAMVSKPVIISALTTILAFSPLLFILGAASAFVIAIPIVVIVTLLFSLLESFCILPMHLLVKDEPVSARRNVFLRSLDTVRAKADAGLQYLIYDMYRPFLDKVLKRKILSFMTFVSVCIFIMSFAVSGWLKFTFEANVMADFIQVNMEFPPGIPMAIKEDAMMKLENSSEEVRAQLEAEFPDKDMVKGSVFWAFSGDTQIGAYLAINPEETRDVGPEEISRRWRELTPDVPEAKQLTFQYTVNNSNPALNLIVTGNNTEEIKAASEVLKSKLAGYRGVYEVVDSNESATSEAVLSLKPGAENLNITLQDLATQVRQAFYGEEVQRIPRGRDTVKVMVRLPERDRESFATLSDLKIRTSNGDSVPFDMIADVNFRPGVTQISRTDRERTLFVTARVDQSLGNIGEIAEDLNNGYLDEMRSEFPAINLRWAGAQEGENEFLNSLQRNTIFAMFGIFFLLAVAFRSYSQPLIIMTAIPFGYMGAIVGHLILGIDLSMYSILGIVAAAGVVINDNLVLMDYINKLREKGSCAIKAVEKAAEERFRPIFLTSVTTFVGLLPLMTETSVQAQFLIPTVVSLAFGVLFASTVTLLLVPVLYLMLNDFQEWGKTFLQRKKGFPATTSDVTA
jgi:multidrug efflux pump subunit AcrB